MHKHEALELSQSIKKTGWVGGGGGGGAVVYGREPQVIMASLISLTHECVFCFFFAVPRSRGSRAHITTFLF